MLSRLITPMRRILSCALVVLAVCLWPVFPAPGSMRERASAWVASHRTDLPRDYDEIAMYPTEYQNAILSTLAPEERLRYWQRHLGVVGEYGPSLTPAQTAFLRKNISAMADDDGRSRPSVFGHEAMVLFGGRADLFNRDRLGPGPLARRLLNLGLGRTVELLRLRVVESVLSLVTVAARLDDCNCWVQGGGMYDCPGDPSNKACLPNTPHPNEFCQ